ncbi:LysM peptidoglycan-binding domain-containing protein [Methylobacterium sp. NEAU 140]|uniref:LysM peptidoglycan-binding domain-containing protein n=1 Tax=Methylobacterium sp. NEAU 140 TaxID=3064945 RepID=UPI00273542DD|nr:LysM peptidoglycan-binding domain-containing protein [Methylobacterium sp. NEAU 140]MDP4023683.1 LysM peptidoglycan-binding domain-containing protein [Methylobacterium sp. NEAU 140]
MASHVRRSVVLALAGLAAGLGLVLALYGGPEALRRATERPSAETRAAPPPAPGSGAPSPTAPSSTAPGLTSPGPAAPSPGAGKPGAPKAAKPGDGAALDAEAPRFDIVRVEPNGDAVVAGRGAPNTVVEMLVDGRSVARALADPDGQFALVPPALPTGSSEIVLRARTADGRETRSRQSVAVAVAPGRDTRPLVALSDPDRPTVVLSQPGAPDAAGPGARADARAGAPSAAGSEAKPDGRPDARAQAARGKPGAPEGPARVVSVDAEPGGRLYVTGAAPPGAQVRLYLNDTPVAPATAGPDGRVTFTIGRGVAPGRYQVRLDLIDPATGGVTGRAEVPFAMPEAVAAPAEAPRVAGMAAQPGRPNTAAPGAPPARPEPAPENRASGERASADRGPGAASAATSGAGAADRDAARPAAEAQTGAVFVPEISTARIIRGDSLWQISKRIYGRGERYTVIYDANHDQIRNPHRIYPGQVFVLPEKRG